MGIWVAHPSPFSKSKFNLKSDRVNLVAPASHIECLLYLRNTVQTGTRKVDRARKFKCTTSARGVGVWWYCFVYGLYFLSGSKFSIV